MINDRRISKKATYDFDVHTGVDDTDYGLGVYIPDDAIITNVWYNCITNVAGTSSTLLVKAGSTTLTTAEAEATFTADAVGAFTLASSATAIKTDGESEVKVRIGTADLTAGKVDIYIEYFIQ